jgi:excisionase family DNA binding protein
MSDASVRLSERDVARLLGLRVLTVRRLARGGRLPGYPIPGRRSFTFNEPELLDWIRRHPVVPDEDDTET